MNAWGNLRNRRAIFGGERRDMDVSYWACSEERELELAVIVFFDETAARCFCGDWTLKLACFMLGLGWTGLDVSLWRGELPFRST